MKLFDFVRGTTKITGLIGNPVAHSISPILHNTLSMELGIDSVYLPFYVGTGKLGQAVQGLRAIEAAGFNVTIPYKNDVIALLDEVTEEASLMGAVNTVKRSGDRLLGYNTDGDGFVKAFQNETRGMSFENKSVVVLGAGGTARSLCVKLAICGASRLVILNRSLNRAEEIASIVNSKNPNVAIGKIHNEQNEKEALATADIIINTTSVGMHPEISQIPLKNEVSLHKGQVVYDVIYNPSKTMLMSKAEQMGCITINGAGMLFYQGILAYEIWNNISIPNEIIEKVRIEFKSYL